MILIMTIIILANPYIMIKNNDTDNGNKDKIQN